MTLYGMFAIPIGRIYMNVSVLNATVTSFLFLFLFLFLSLFLSPAEDPPGYSPCL